MKSETDSSPTQASKDDGKDDTNTAEETPSSSFPLSPTAASASDKRKKRRSDIQINKDDHPEGDGCSDDDDELNDDGEKRSDPFKRAPEDVLKKRKIVKASSKWGGGGAASSGGGAFASVNLAAAATTSTTAPSFGNAFSTAAKKGGVGSGFGTVSQGFGAVTASSSSTATGFGSASGASSNGFGAKKEDTDKSSTTTETKPSVFGGGFGAVSSGFGAAKSGFGAVTTASPSGFGSTVTSTATSPDGDDDKGAKEKNKSGDTSPDKELKGEKTTTNSTTPTQSTLFPPTAFVAVNNGEENEECLCQVVAKLYKMVPDVKEADVSDMDKGDVPSVPSTSGRFGDVNKQDNNKEEGTNSSSKNSGKDEKEGSSSTLVRKEAGVGNVRVLKLRSFGDKEKNENKSLGRVVQRQRGSNSLILNIRLIPKQCKVTRPGEKFVQLNAPSKDGTLESFLFRLKTNEDSDNLVKNLESMLQDMESA